MGTSKEKFGITPIKLDLIGTRGDDIYVRFDEFTINGDAYPSGTTAVFFAQDRGDALNNWSESGLFDYDLQTPANLKKVLFKLTAVNNAVVTEYDYDIQVTYPNNDILTHVIGTLTIEGDINQ